tara:strand:+ start:1116 stop:1934 length:819 start_codon:yes stop_codon:yes gene_type:complete
MPLTSNEEDWFFPVEPERSWEFPNKRDCKAIKGALWDQCQKMGMKHNPLGWSEHDSYLSLFFQARWEAHQVAAEKDISVEAAWSKLRKRVLQNVEDIIKHPIKLTRHYDTMFRKAYAIAAQQFPLDTKKRFEMATELIMENSDERTREAWHAYNMYGQQSLFEVVAKHEEKEVTLLETIPDPTSTGTDPVDGQVSFLEHSLSEESTFTERQKDIIELLAYEPMSNVKIAEQIGCDEKTVRREIKAIKLSGISQGWLEVESDEGDEEWQLMQS